MHDYYQITFIPEKICAIPENQIQFTQFFPFLNILSTLFEVENVLFLTYNKSKRTLLEFNVIHYTLNKTIE